MENIISTILGIVQFIIIIYILIFELKKKSPALFLWATLCIMFGVMHLLTVFNDNSINDIIYIKASLFVIIFSAFYILFRKIFSNQECFTHKLEEKWSRYKDDTATRKIILIFIIVSFALNFDIISHSGGILNSSWASFRDYTVNLSYLNSSQFLTITFISSAPIWILVNNREKCITSYIICSIIIFTAIISRNRIMILPFLIPFIIKQLIDKTIKISTLMKGVFFTIASIYLVYGLRVFRHVGSIETFLETFSFIGFVDKINEYLVTDNGELGLRRVFYFFISYDNNFEGFSEAATYIRMLLVYLPSHYSFGIKPDDFAITMGKAIGMVYGGSVHPTLFGDCFANLGFMGIFLGIFWGVYACFMDYLLMRINSSLTMFLTYSLMSISYVIIARGSVYNGFFFLAWGLPILLLIYEICKLIKRVKIRI